MFLAIAVVALAAIGNQAYALPSDWLVVWGGMNFTRQTILFGVGLISVLLLFITDVGALVFWLLGITTVSVGAHSTLYQPTAAAISSDPEHL